MPDHRPLLTSLLVALAALAATAAAATTQRPNVWIVGDSTVRNRTAGQMGWGDPLVAEFDPARAEVHNRAIGGRSSRTFRTEGRWDAILANVVAGDFVLMQFGHNDGGSYFEGSRPRASVKGTGDETVEGVVERTGAREVVHSYGWYLRRYCEEARARGATPVVVSPIPRNRRDDRGRVFRADGDYALWARQAAADAGAAFVDLNATLAARYDALGPEETDRLFCGTDHTHTSPAGAAFNARVLAEELRRLPVGLDRLLRAPDCWLPRVFGDHMVLQRDRPIRVWGRTRPGHAVSVRLGDASASTDADDDGRWSLELPAQPASGPHRLEVEAAAQRRFDDVWVGEVWLCAGQSNMDFTVAPSAKRPFAGARDWREEVARGDVPGIRMFTAEYTLREEPQPDVDGAWRVASPETVGDFSAVAWFFARRLHDELDVPVGLVTLAHGASTAEAWTSRTKLASVPELAGLLRSFDDARRAFRDAPERLAEHARARERWLDGGRRGRAPRHPDPVHDQHSPCVLFDGMVHPVVGYGVRGALWYQGESNVDSRARYPALQRALIEDWRARWSAPLPFYLVQLAAHRALRDEPADSSWAEMRAAQATALTLPHTGMVVTTDVGDADDVHPRDKQTVGRRLARLALARTYGREVVASGPSLRRAIVEGARVRLQFDHVADGLAARGGGPLTHFAVAGDDREFVWARATIDGDDVLVQSDDVAAPRFVRYAWSDNPAAANLVNSAGLPAAPFATDRR